MAKKITRSLEERRIILAQIVLDFKTKYVQYFNKDYQMPAPTLPASLNNVDLSRKQMAQIPIDPIQKSVLCGTCLGDSSLRIQKNYKSARIQNRHSSRQAAWFLWKWSVCLKKYVPESSSALQFQNADGKQLKSELKEGEEFLGKLKLATIVHPDLTALHSVICPNNKDIISRSWLNHMNNYFLMTLWLDDGSLYNGKQGLICLQSTPVDEQKILIEYLKAVWDIETFLVDSGTVMSNGLKAYNIHLKDQNNLLKLLRLIAPIIPVKEMLYKVMFVPNNTTGLLQRWASEVTELVMPEFRSYVSEEYKKKIN